METVKKKSEVHVKKPTTLLNTRIFEGILLSLKQSAVAVYKECLDKCNNFKT